MINTGTSDRRVALVSGASGGVGRAIAVDLARTGFAVALTGRDSARLKSVRREAAGHGVPTLALVADLTDRGEPERAVHDVCKHLGSVDVLVNSIGAFGPVTPFHEADPNAWLETLDVNLVVPYRLCRAALPSMLEGHWGRIINVTSAATQAAPMVGNSAYATSKVGLERLTRHIAAEVSGTGVTANLLHPGDVRTGMWAAIRDAARASGGSTAALGEWAAKVERTGGDPPELAARLVREIVEDAGTLNGAFLGLPDAPNRTG